MTDDAQEPEDLPVSDEELEVISGGLGASGVPEVGEAAMVQGLGEAGVGEAG